MLYLHLPSMKFRPHSLVSTLLAVLYGGMMLFGQGLHELVDCEHCHGHGHVHTDAEADEDGHCGLPHPSCQAARRSTAPGCKCEHAHPASRAEDSHAGDHDDQYLVMASTNGGVSEVSDCPICQFHSQGQLRAPADASTDRRVPTVTLSRTTPLVWSEFTLGVHSPRGPPA
jgi:hypothetical protein